MADMLIQGVYVCKDCARWIIILKFWQILLYEVLGSVSINLNIIWITIMLCLAIIGLGAF